MQKLLSVKGYMLSHERDLCELCDDLDRVTMQEQPLLDKLVEAIHCPTGVDNEGDKTYPIELLKLHFGS